MKKSQLRQIIREEVKRLNEGTTLQPKNLKTTKYRNGDPIRFAQSKQDWFDAGNKKEGAYCISPSGGYLYNWYAVSDPRGLCRVPTHQQWKQVNDIESLKNGGPQGIRDRYGEFSSHRAVSYFWSSTEYKVNAAWSRVLETEYSELDSSYFNKSAGLSIRCL